MTIFSYSYYIVDIYDIPISILLPVADITDCKEIIVLSKVPYKDNPLTYEYGTIFILETFSFGKIFLEYSG